VSAQPPGQVVHLSLNDTSGFGVTVHLVAQVPPFLLLPLPVSLLYTPSLPPPLPTVAGARCPLRVLRSVRRRADAAQQVSCRAVARSDPRAG